MIKIKCDRCGQNIPIEESRLSMYEIFKSNNDSRLKSEYETLNVSTFSKGILRQFDLCNKCKSEVYTFIIFNKSKESENT